MTKRNIVEVGIWVNQSNMPINNIKLLLKKEKINPLNLSYLRTLLYFVSKSMKKGLTRISSIKS